jgi:glutamyl-tRNA synthetase/glutamyl-Q tRNA(Asp) synthetase
MLTRFAPSPTGYLHLGHVVNAIYVWGLARASNGRVLLRIEDHDRIRCRPDYEAALLEDLAWLGFEPDAGLSPLLRQSDRADAYARALAGLRSRCHVYACDCSRKRIAAEQYDGFCRTRGLAEGPGRGVRVQVDDGHDLLLRDRDGHWTYQFAVTVDDLEQGITHVIRGDDLASSTERQLQLRRMLGATDAPAYVHHPLIVKPNGEKLSKSAGDSGVCELRGAGVSAADVIGRAAAAVGLISAPRPVAARDVVELFLPTD